MASLAGRSTQYPATVSDVRTTSNSKDAPPEHGLKRSAEDNLENEQRFSKRFNLLNIEDSGKLWISPGISSSSGSSNAAVIAARTRAPRLRSVEEKDDCMQVEDTKDRVYIHNLDEELESDEESLDGERVIFLPDIERRLNTLPKEVFMNEEQLRNSAHAGNELVLYSVPNSLSVPREKDSVRKAIIESRARARQKREDDLGVPSSDSLLHDKLQYVDAMKTQDAEFSGASRSSHLSQAEHYYDGDYYGDAMDIG